MTPATILVWYFLSASNNNIATQGPFVSQQQCEQLADWATKTTWARYASQCYSAPLAAPQRSQGEYCTKGCRDE